MTDPNLGQFSETDLPRRVNALENTLENLAVSNEDLALELKASRQESDQSPASRAHRLQRIAFLAGKRDALEQLGFTFPSYNWNGDYITNAQTPFGPRLGVRPTAGLRWRLFGSPIDFPIGIGSSVLCANAMWVEYFAGNGFNILTYKTVRSRFQREYTPPHWAIVDPGTEFRALPDPNDPITVSRLDWLPSHTRELSTANSFGIPSSSPAIWQLDVAAAINTLAPGQMLIVSVIGSAEFRRSKSALIRDFTRTARLAEEAGAEVIELNLSFPTMLDPRTKRVSYRLVCEDAKLCKRIVHAVRTGLRSDNTRIIVKLGYLDTSP